MRVLPILTVIAALSAPTTSRAQSAAAAPASRGDWSLCSTLSFAPIDDNLPACGRVLADPELPDLRRAEALAARASASLWALTYHNGHEVEPAALMRSALADLDQAIILDPRHHGDRAELLHRLGRYEEAVAGYNRAMEAEPDSAMSYLVGRSYSYEALGEIQHAIADMDAALAVADTPPDQARALTRRGGLREGVKEIDAAIADYEKALAIVPEHAGAVAALERLRPGE